MIATEERSGACDTDAMSADRTVQAPPELLAVRARIDQTLDRFLIGVRDEMAGVAPDALLPIDEVIRLTMAGGKRLRPMFCFWGYRAVGGADDGRIERAAAALELLHTMALIHDDLMDRSPDRRGAPASAFQLADRARARGSSDPERAGTSMALLAGDLANVLADRLLLTSGFEPPAPRRRAGPVPPDANGDGPRSSPRPRRWRHRSGGGRETQGRLLHRGGPAAHRCRARGGRPRPYIAALAAFGAPLGLAFQLLDDERDGEAVLDPGRVAGLIAQARAGLDAPGLDPEAVGALRAMADLVAAG